MLRERWWACGDYRSAPQRVETRNVRCRCPCSILGKLTSGEGRTSWRPSCASTIITPPSSVLNNTLISHYHNTYFCCILHYRRNYRVPYFHTIDVSKEVVRFISRYLNTYFCCILHYRRNYRVPYFHTIDAGKEVVRFIWWNLTSQIQLLFKHITHG